MKGLSNTQQIITQHKTKKMTTHTGTTQETGDGKMTR